MPDRSAATPSLPWPAPRTKEEALSWIDTLVSIRRNYDSDIRAATRAAAVLGVPHGRLAVAAGISRSQLRAWLRTEQDA
jgi:hypothetical protein